MAVYPDATISFTPRTDGVDDVMSSDINTAFEEITAIQTELGMDVKGTAADLVTRLDMSLSDGGSLQFSAHAVLTIASDTVTPTQNYHTVDTEGSESADDLVTITATNCGDGFVLVLRQNNSARDVTVKHGTGNIRCPGAVDIVMTTVNSIVICVYDDDDNVWLVMPAPDNTALLNRSNTFTAPNTFSSGFNRAYTSVSSSDTVLDSSYYAVDVDATAGATTVTLPTAASISGREYLIRKLDASANNVTIVPNGVETINGAASYVIADQYETIGLMATSAGTSWMTFGVGAAGTGDIATDTIWDTKGDIAVATGANAAVVLPVGSDGLMLTASSTDTTGVKWSQAALRSDKLSVFAATTSLELAGVISDETGSGALMFGTSPTITTSLIMSDGATIGQAAGPLLNFDDTNNYLEITGANVGIGSTAPGAKLHVVGAASAITAILQSDVTTPDNIIEFQNSIATVLGKFHGTTGLTINVPDVTVVNKNKYIPLISGAAGVMFRYQDFYWDGGAYVATTNYGVGVDTLGSNTGANSNGFGYAALQNNTGANSNGFGHLALQNNTGANSNGFGHAALQNNTGAYSNGFGYYALQNNTGAYSNGFGHLALQNNTGANSNGFGHAALYYNNWNNVIGLGHQTSAYWLSNAATDKAFTDAEVSGAAHTITFGAAHGFGTVGGKINLLYTKTAGATSPTGLVSGTVYQFTVTSATILTLAGITDAGSADFEGKLTNSADIHDSVAIGLDANADKAHQVVLGNVATVETILRGNLSIFGHAAQGQQAHIADATNAADVITRVNAILVALETLGILAP
jgi:hypothetical protein